MRHIFYGWWIVLAGALIMVSVSGAFFYGFTAFVDPIKNEFGWTYAAISIIFTLRNLEEGFLTPVAGFLADRYGPRRILIISIGFVGLGYLLLSRTSSVGTFYAYYTILAIAFSGVASTVLYTPLAHWFKKKLTFVLGLMAAGYGASGAMVPLLVWLIGAYQWRTTFIVLAIITLALGIPLSLVMRHKPGPYGYLPDGEVLESHLEKAESVELTEEEPVASLQLEDDGFTWREALRTRAFWIIAGVFALGGLATNGMFSLMMPHLYQSGLSEGLSGIVVAFMTATSISGRLGFGWLGDRMDKRRALVICMVMELAGIVVFTQIREAWHVIPFLILFAPGFGGTVPLIPALQVEHFGAKAFGTLRGLTLMAAMFGGMPSPVIAGWLADITGNFRLGFLVLATPLLVAIPLPLFLKRREEPG